MKTALTIGTRGSPLALAQAGEVEARLRAAHPALGREGAIARSVIKTTGDKVLDRPLYEMGGKGLFTKEIEEALLDGRIDLAVHSVKDLPAFLPPGLAVVCILPREDPRDVLVSAKARSIAELLRGARIGTSSPRRQAQILALRPDLEIVGLRGNVETRLRKIRDGEADATLLALAGLRRLGLEAEATAVLDSSEFLPAVGQGALGIECRADDARVRDLLAPLNDPESAASVAAERALLAALEGSCRTPIAGLAEISGGEIALRALIASPDGRSVLRTERRGAVKDAARLGADAGAELRARAGNDFFAPA
jgi:hydroxymethylbilane synthase